MPIAHLLNKTTVILRLSAISGMKSAFSTVTSTISHIQQISNNDTQVEQGIFGQIYRIYMEEGTDVQEGDNLRDSDNNIYVVLSGGVQKRSFGSISFAQVDCQKTR